MKKIKLFSGLSAIIALAALAISAITFTSCEKEEFNIKPVGPVENARVLFNVSAMFIDNDMNVTDVTKDVTFTNINKIVGTPAIPAQTISITASYEGKTQVKELEIAAIKSGQIVYNVTFIFTAEKINIVETVEYDSASGTAVESTEVEEFVNENTSYDFDSKKWFENETDLEVKVKLSHIINSCVLVPNSIIITDGDAYGHVYKAAKELEKKGDEETKEFTVAPMSIARFNINKKYTLTTYTVNKVITKETKAVETKVIEVGSFVMKKLTSVEYEKIEIQHPESHNGHDHGHGHGHGNGNNAGGGVVDAD